MRESLSQEMFKFFKDHCPLLKKLAANLDFVLDFFEMGHNRDVS